MIDPQAEAIKRLISMAKSGAQRTPLVPRVSVDPSDPPVGMLWIREDEQKAYLKTADDTTLMVASAEPVAGDGGQVITDRSLPGISLMLNTITSDEIADDAVTRDELAPRAVEGEAFAEIINAISQVNIKASRVTGPALKLDADFDHGSDVLQVLRDGVQLMRVHETHSSFGLDLPSSYVSINTPTNTTGLRIRSGGSPLLAEKANGQTLLSVDASGNLVVAGSISSLSGNSGTAGSLAVQGALTVTDQANLLAGLSVTGRTDLRAEVDVDGQATFNAEIFLQDNYSAKVGSAVHLRTLPLMENRLLLEGVSDIGVAEVQLGTGGPVLSGSLNFPDRMFIGEDRIVTSAADGIRGNQLATDTITGGNGPGVGNIASETITGYNILNGSITSTELSPGAVVRAAIDSGAVGPVQLADGSVIDRVVASMGVGKLISGTLNADEIFMGPSGHIYLGPTFSDEILNERIQIDSSGIRAYNAFNTPLAEFTPGGFTLRTGVDGARMSFSALEGLELFGLTGQRTGYLSPLGEFQLDSAIDGARMTLTSGEGVQFYAGATVNLAFNPGFIGSSEHEVPVAGEASDDQRHVFAGEYAVRFRATNPNINAPSYVDVPFKNTVGTGSSVTRTRVNHCPNPSVETASTGWLASAQTSQILSFGPVLGFIRDRAVWVTASAPGAASIQAPVASTPVSTQWALSCSVRVSTAQNVTADIIWYDINSAVIQTDISTPFALKTNVVTQIGLVKVAPSNAVTFRLRVSASLQNTDRLDVSNVLYERTSGIDAYADGYTEGYQWDGTPGNSTSSLIPVAVLDSANNLLSVFVWSDVSAWAQIEGRDSTLDVSRGLSSAMRLTPNQWSRVLVQCSGVMDKVRLHYPSEDPSRQTRIVSTPVWWSGVQVEADKDIPTPFCSGNEPGCRWEGLEGKSPSIRDRDVVVTQISPTLGTTVSGAIVGGSLTSASFFAGRIFGTEITGVNIKGSTLTGNLITGDQILAGTIQGTSIVSRSITADRLVADSITANEIAANAITTLELSADSVTAVKIVARTITSDRIAVGTLQADVIGAGQITADKLQANMILSQRIIVGAATTGARLELTPGTGLQAFRSTGVRTFWIDSATGNITAIGTWRTGTSGERIEILTDGTQYFYASNGAVSGVIENTTGGLVLRGAGTFSATTGRFFVVNSSASLGFGTNMQSVSSFRVDGAGTQQWGRLVGMRYERRFAGDGTLPRIFMLATGDSGEDIGPTVWHFTRAPSGWGALLVPSSGCGIQLTNNAGGELWVNDSNGENWRPVRASGFPVASSISTKQDISEIEFPNQRTSWDLIEGAPSLDWRYIHEIPREHVPMDSGTGAPLQLRKRNLEISNEEWEALPENDPSRWIWEDAPAVPAASVHRKHRFPLAEDLYALDPEMVRGDNNDPDAAVDLRDAIGILWDAVDMLIKRNRMIEDRLMQRLPVLNFPGRPQRGDVVEGIGALIQGRTRRQVDALTGQIRDRIRDRLIGG